MPALTPAKDAAMAKAKKHKPPKRPARAPISPPTRESVLDLAEKASEWIRKTAPLEPSGAERAERVAAQKKMGRYIAIRDGQVPPPWVASNAETPNSRASIESNSPATVNKTKTATKTWITDEAQRMKAAGEIPAEIKITPFAKLLADRMAADPSIHAVTWRYIKNELPIWDLWPISKIKI
jgi:hypothetical protein